MSPLTSRRRPSRRHHLAVVISPPGLAQYSCPSRLAPSSLPESPGRTCGDHRPEDRVRLRLIPREERFFDLFVQDAANVLGAARLLEAMLRSYDQLPRRAGEIRDAEHRGDEISHDIGHRLEATFVTPFDREEIHSLISGLDDVLDLIEETADTFVLYRIDAPTAAAIES